MDTKTVHALEKQLRCIHRKEIHQLYHHCPESPEPLRAEAGRVEMLLTLHLEFGSSQTYTVGHCESEDTEWPGPWVSSAMSALMFLTAL